MNAVYDKVMMAMPVPSKKPVKIMKRIGMYNTMLSKRLGVYNTQNKKKLGVYN